MIVVIQCAARKQLNAGTLRTRAGKPVCFVANPPPAPHDRFAYARPDDLSDTGETWRNVLIRYNRESALNELGLLPACDLYAHSIYRRLAERFGFERLYILSAGWGLIAASFLTPLYDITFSAQAEFYKRRRQSDVYDDFCMLPVTTAEPVVFFGGKDYLPLFHHLTQDVTAPRTAFYRSAQTPDLPGITLVRFETTRRTNWHYECAETFLEGGISLPSRQ